MKVKKLNQYITYKYNEFKIGGRTLKMIYELDNQNIDRFYLVLENDKILLKTKRLNEAKRLFNANDELRIIN